MNERWCACGNYNTTIWKMCLRCSMSILSNYTGPLPPKGIKKDKANNLTKLVDKALKLEPTNTFVKSVAKQYREKGSLSVRQIAALKKILK